MSNTKPPLRSRRSLLAPLPAKTNATGHPRVAESLIDSAGDALVIPPKDARVQTSACAFCVVGCGYKVYTWPLGDSGGESAEDNAIGVDLPAGALQPWFTRSMHNIVDVDG